MIAGILPFAFANFGIEDKNFSAAIMTVYCSMSVICFGAYGIDKWLSVKEDKRRITESTHHVLEILGGWPGALFAQIILKHKTQKKPFIYILYGIMLVHIAGWIFYYSSL